VKDHAARVDDPAKPRSDKRTEAGGNLQRAIRFVGSVAFPLSGDLRTDRVNHAGVTKLADQRGVGRLIDERAYTRQGVSWLNPGTPYPMHRPNEIRLAGV